MTSCTLLFSLRIDYDRWSAGTQEADKNACAVRDTIHGQFKPLTALSKKQHFTFLAVRRHQTPRKPQCSCQNKWDCTQAFADQQLTTRKQHSEGGQLVSADTNHAKMAGKAGFSYSTMSLLAVGPLRCLVNWYDGRKNWMAKVRKEQACELKVGFPPGN